MKYNCISNSDLKIYINFDYVFRPSWITRVLCLVLVSFAIGGLFVIRTWIVYLVITAPDINTRILLNDAKTATWLRRAWMYAESTKENQNADRNNSISAPQQFYTNSSG